MKSSGISLSRAVLPRHHHVTSRLELRISFSNIRPAGKKNNGGKLLFIKTCTVASTMTFKRTFLLRPTSLLLLTALLLGLLQHVDAFTLTKLSTVSNRAHISNTFRCQATNRKGDRGDDEPEESIEEGHLGILCLPPIG